ncbi:MAG: hypothetical protein M0Z66_04575 [Thermaerobacter sp.]|nr:hypothetical protein [Thermaerobacter sp.]
MDPRELLATFSGRQDEILAGIAELVGIESPTSAPDRVERAIGCLATRLAAAGCEIETADAEGYVRPVIARLGRGPRSILVLCHLDTVWPVGEIECRPVKVAEGRAYGPGIYDMKAGASLSVFALEEIVR